MRRHTEIGARHLSAVPLLAPAARFVRAHHERVDGGGYPDGLAGDAIPLEARIISVCDAYDAMANTRQYRRGMGAERAEAVLREHAGSQWDPDVVAVAVRVLREIDGRNPAFDNVGRGVTDVDTGFDGCVCADALPALTAR
jgi:HD-GYP domain-containing protein (c-di-GMP phosphodiesterase class II)